MRREDESGSRCPKCHRDLDIHAIFKDGKIVGYQCFICKHFWWKRGEER